MKDFHTKLKKNNSEPDMTFQTNCVSVEGADSTHRRICKNKLHRPRLVAVISISVLTIVFVSIACLSRRQCFQNNSCNFQIDLEDDQPSRRSHGKVKSSCGISENVDPQKRLPQCIIIGVRKAGTGALLHFLQMHPDIQVHAKELAFFDFYYENGIDWYRNQLPISYKGQITIEKTSNYFHNSNAIERIYNMNNTIKLILVVRDPVERAISDHLQRQLMVETEVNFPSFEDVVLDPDIEDLKYKILKPSLYYKHMKKWLRYFPLKQIHIVDGENLVKNPHVETFKVETFLGLQHCVTEKYFVFNSKKGFYCLNKPFKNTYKTRCLPKTKGRRHPDVKPEVIQTLQEYFRPLNEKFYNLIGRRFEW